MTRLLRSGSGAGGYRTLIEEPTGIGQVTRHTGPQESTGVFFPEGEQSRGSGAQADLPGGQCVGGSRGVGRVRSGGDESHRGRLA